jgi:predicted Zn-dependent protease
MVGSPPSAQDIEDIASAMAEVSRLMRHVAKFREKVVSVFGADAPESASRLIDALAQMNDPTSRSGLYKGAVTESLLGGYQSAAERIAVAAHEEFQDIFSLMSLSQTLMDVGKLSEGLSHAKAALAQAMSEQVLLNYAAGHLMRQAVKTGSAEVVNEALEALVDSTQVPRTSDCALETDWIDAAEALGADKVLTDWVRAVAKKRGFRPRDER